MATEAELQAALMAGGRFRQAIHKVTFRPDTDQVVFATPWGEKIRNRADILEFRDLTLELMSKINVSAVGIHIYEADVDINSAGLLAYLFPKLKPELVDAY